MSWKPAIRPSSAASSSMRARSRHGQLEGLALVAHVGGEIDLPVGGGNRVGVEARLRVREQALGHGGERWQAFAGGGQHLRAHQVVGEIGVQDAVGRQGAGALGEHHAGDAELVGHGDRVQARRPAERDHDEVARIEALLEQREADGRAQVGVGDGEQALGARLQRQAERAGNVVVDGGASRGARRAACRRRGSSRRRAGRARRWRR